MCLSPSPSTRFAQEVERILLLVAAATILVGVMFFDDVIGIPPIPKLGIQVASRWSSCCHVCEGRAHGIAIEQLQRAVRRSGFVASCRCNPLYRPLDRRHDEHAQLG